MFKKISKFTLLFLLGLQTLFAASVNDGYVEYQNGNNQQAVEIFKKACEKGFVNIIDYLIKTVSY